MTYLMKLIDKEGVVVNFHKSVVVGSVVSLSFWEMIFVALRYDV